MFVKKFSHIAPCFIEELKTVETANGRFYLARARKLSVCDHRLWMEKNQHLRSGVRRIQKKPTAPKSVATLFTKPVRTI